MYVTTSVTQIRLIDVKWWNWFNMCRFDEMIYLFIFLRDWDVWCHVICFVWILRSAIKMTQISTFEEFLHKVRHFEDLFRLRCFRKSALFLKNRVSWMSYHTASFTNHAVKKKQAEHNSTKKVKWEISEAMSKVISGEVAIRKVFLLESLVALLLWFGLDCDVLWSSKHQFSLWTEHQSRSACSPAENIHISSFSHFISSCKAWSSNLLPLQQRQIHTFNNVTNLQHLKLGVKKLHLSECRERITFSELSCDAISLEQSVTNI